MALNSSMDRRRLAARYLSHMGIESWDLRESDADRTGTGQAIEGAETIPRRGYELSVEQIGNWLGSVPAKVIGLSVSGAPVLAIAEAPELQQPELDLLQAMLGAIKIEKNQQCLLQLGDIETDNQPDSAVACQQLVSELVPLCIVLLLRLPRADDISGLDQLRGGFKSLGWARMPVAVSLHPGDILANPQLKRPAWEDLKQVKSFLDNH